MVSQMVLQMVLVLCDERTLGTGKHLFCANVTFCMSEIKKKQYK